MSHSLKNGKSLVCIPTFNEALNIEHTVSQVQKHAIDSHILIVDDASPDGTGKLAEKLAIRWEHIHVLHRPSKEGLGKAHMAALTWGLENKFDLLIQFDADGSHDAMYLPEILEQLRHAELVVASRSVPGGGSCNWALHRRVLSFFANVYLRAMLSMPIRDLTSGYNGFRRELLEKVHLEKIRSSGYAFQIELKHRCIHVGSTFKEIPIIFKPRKNGLSKMTHKDIFEAVVVPLLLHSKKQRHSLKKKSEAPFGQ